MSVDRPPIASFAPRLAHVVRIARIAMADNDAYPDRPADYILMHGRRVAGIALDLRAELRRSGKLRTAVAREVLHTGALFHDLGKAGVDDGLGVDDAAGAKTAEPHESVGAERAVKLLAHLFTPDELRSIHDIILHHNHREQPNDHAPAVKIVQDADLLDHVGMVATWLTAYRTAREGGTLEDALRYTRSASQAQEREAMRRRLNFEASVRRFDARTAREAAYYQTLEGLG